jgi:hypothetical protein
VKITPENGPLGIGASRNRSSLNGEITIGQVSP